MGVLAVLVCSDSDKARVLAAARAASQKEFVKSTPTWPADLPMRTDENGVQWADFRPEKSDNNINRGERLRWAPNRRSRARRPSSDRFSTFLLLFAPHFVCPAFATLPPFATRTATLLAASTART